MYYDNEQKLTRLTLECGDRKVSWEMPYTDITIEDLIDAFYSLCIGITFSPRTVEHWMKEWVEEHVQDDEPCEIIEDE